MKKFVFLAAAALASVGVGGAANAAVDVADAPTGFFAPNQAATTSAPYYRSANQDWGWQHGSIAAGFTSASLNISAYDVDAAPCGRSICEVDNIYALDGATWVLLGALQGANNVYAFTTFNLSSNFFDDIVAGLQVKIDIDSLNGGWLVTLGKSTLTTDGTAPGNPNPGAVPEPASWAMMMIGFGLTGAALRRRKMTVRFAG